METFRKLTETLARTTTRRNLFGKGAGVATGALLGVAAGYVTRPGTSSSPAAAPSASFPVLPAHATACKNERNLRQALHYHDRVLRVTAAGSQRRRYLLRLRLRRQAVPRARATSAAAAATSTRPGPELPARRSRERWKRFASSPKPSPAPPRAATSSAKAPASPRARCWALLPARSATRRLLRWLVVASPARCPAHGGVPASAHHGVAFARSLASS